MPEKEIVPAIRFKGFTDAWEQRKLGDAFTQTVGYVNPKLENIELWSLTLEKGLTPKTERYIRDFLVLKEDKYKAVRPNDVVYNPMNMTLGAIGYNDMPITVAVSGYYVTMKPSNSIDGYYIKTWMQLAQSIELYKAHATGSLLEKQRVQYPTFSEIKFTVPSLVEQQKIGAFFRNLDKLITLHQRKLLKLKNVKKAMLEKMFPRNGNNVPEIRFAGFTDAWEQRKLGELAQYRRGSFPQPYGKEEWYNGDGAMPFVQVVDVTNSLALAENTKQKISRIAQPKSIFVPKGKVIVTLQGSIGRIAITQYDCFVDRTLLIFESYNRAIDVVFWAYTMQMKFDIEKEKAPGGTIKTITKEALTDFVISLPKYEEQQRIGTFFRQLDNLITLHQRKYEKLQNLKKACIEKMFI